MTVAITYDKGEYMDAVAEIREQIRRSIPSLFKNLTELAEVAQVNQPNLSVFMKQEKDAKRKSMNLETAWKIWEAIRKRSETVGFIRHIRPNAAAEAINGNEAQLKTIHVYDTAGAGSGFIELSKVKPLFSIAIPPTYFRRSDFAVLVDGHSMEPTIIHRSVVGAQQGFEFKANELYVARIPYEGLVVKRIAVSQDKERFIFKSDNKDKDNYPDYELIIAEAEKIIMGRIVWVMYRY
jgi:phage repressor protein C with HTH and peptisase S24 domain